MNIVTILVLLVIFTFFHANVIIKFFRPRFVSSVSLPYYHSVTLTYLITNPLFILFDILIPLDHDTIELPLIIITFQTLNNFVAIAILIGSFVAINSYTLAALSNGFVTEEQTLVALIVVDPNLYPYTLGVSYFITCLPISQTYTQVTQLSLWLILLSYELFCICFTPETIPFSNQPPTP